MLMSDLISIIALFLITALLIMAALKGIDGALLSTGIGTMAGIAGYQVGKSRKSK